jgi:hypothetical protein
VTAFAMSSVAALAGAIVALFVTRARPRPELALADGVARR